MKDPDWRTIIEAERRRHERDRVPANLLVAAAFLSAVLLAVLAALGACWILGGI